MKFITIILSLALLTTVNAYSKGHQDHKMKNVMKKLNLTDEQKAQVKSIREEFKDKIKAARENTQKLRKEFKTAKKTKSDTSEVSTKHDSMVDAQSEVKKLNFEKRMKISKILNEEQRTKFKEFWKKKNHKQKSD